jgi:hypothetical protein
VSTTATTPLAPTQAPLTLSLEARTITLGPHSIQRYWERVKASLPNTAAASEDLAVLIANCGRLTARPPSWALEGRRRDTSRERPAVMWLLIGDDVALPLAACQYQPRGLFALTCLSRGCLSDEAIARRARERRAAARQRALTRRLIRGSRLSHERRTGRHHTLLARTLEDGHDLVEAA